MGSAKLSVWITGSRARDYHTLTELRADAAVVVRATAIGAKSVTNEDRPPVTITTMRVEQTLAGRELRDTVVPVMQPGIKDMVIEQDGMGRRLTVGSEYVLFLVPNGGQLDNGWHSIVGGQGVYENDRSTGRYVFVGAGKPDLPATLALADLSA